MRTVLCLVFVVIVIVHTGAVEKGCAFRWKQYYSKCYIYQGSVTWQGAADVCAEHGADIINCRSTAEFDFIRNQMADPQTDFWLNAKDDVSEGTWVWQDTNTTITTWARWHNGPLRNKQPNGGVTENCLAMSPKSGTWWDKPCTDSLDVFCVRPTEESNACSVNWDLGPYGCYRMYKNRHNFNQATAHCKSLGASVTSAKSKEENEFLSNMTGAHTIWLNLQWDAQADEWVWQDDQQTLGDYNEWTTAYTKPDATSTRCCVHLYGRVWQTTRCSSYGWYYQTVCVKSKTAPTTATAPTVAIVTTTQFNKCDDKYKSFLGHCVSPDLYNWIPVIITFMVIVLLLTIAVFALVYYIKRKKDKQGEIENVEPKDDTRSNNDMTQTAEHGHTSLKEDQKQNQHQNKQNQQDSDTEPDSLSPVVIDNQAGSQAQTSTNHTDKKSHEQTNSGPDQKLIKSGPVSRLKTLSSRMRKSSASTTKTEKSSKSTAKTGKTSTTASKTTKSGTTTSGSSDATEESHSQLHKALHVFDKYYFKDKK